MKNLIIGYIANSLESGMLQNLVIQALRKLVARTSNTVDDKIVDLLAQALKNEKVDSAITEAMAKVAEKVK
jgi:flagellar biosynthesis/type III secretory pathway protein FliH